MSESSDVPPDFMGQYLAGAVGMHEMFLSYIQAGFTRMEALQIIIGILQAGMRNHPDGR